MFPLKDKRIFYIEDNVSNLALVQMILEQQGAKVYFERWGNEADIINRLKSFMPVDLILLDLMMPVMDGVAAIRALKHINPQVKVIAGTGLGSHPKMDLLGDLGVTHFVAKPYTAETILRELESVLGGNGATSAPPDGFGRA